MTDGAVARGSRLFARYAHAPNELGYCGPASAAALEHAACGGGDPAVVAAAARQFTGAWPYQQLIAAQCGIVDPLDERVVRAYWTRNLLTDRIDVHRFGSELLTGFGDRAGHYWSHLTADLLPEVTATHAFHVFGVYPWSRLLETGMPQPLHVLDSCRIGWGKVLEVSDDDAAVRVRRLEYDGTRLALGAEAVRRVGRRTASGVFVPGLRVGEQVALHWDFVCDRLTEEEAGRLESWTVRQLGHTNRRLGSR
ncbi:DUF6390 family protein [Rhodococcus phenolicus]|uniref:DUF6390 family protein n=1 Tax=Rhodococcus phenolicus TaxID=263849 RepID=UPI00082A14CC|nr:DUF6390 family protein [Rhodococcus phenolicus]